MLQVIIFILIYLFVLRIVLLIKDWFLFSLFSLADILKIKKGVLKMNEELKELLKDENINIFKNKDDDLYVEVYSYNMDLSENEEHTNKIFNKIVELKNDIAEYYNKDYFIISIDSFSIDGLFESNSYLINNKSILTNLY